MSGGLLSLKWNNHCSTFLQILSNLHKKQTYHDATVACGGALYPVHKIVLSTCSEYFEEMFDSINDKHPIIVLKDIKGEVFEALLKYMYIGEVNVIQDRLNDLINAAECLKIKGLAVPDEDPSEGSARPNRSTSTNNNSSVSTKRRHEHSDSSNSQPPFKVHKSVKNVNPSNSIKEPKNFRETSAEKERSPNANSNDPLFQEDDDDVIEEVPIKQEREEYEAEASSSSVPSKEKRPQNQANVDQKSGKESSAEQTEDLSKVEILEEEDCGSNSADQWTGANMGEEENFSYLGDSNSGAAEDMRGQDDTAEGDANEGMRAQYASMQMSSRVMPHLLPHNMRQVSFSVRPSPDTLPLTPDVAVMQRKCFLCPYLATSNTELVIHERSHSEGMHFTCSFCTYRTVYKNNLKSHMRKHTGENKFFCEYCPYKAKHRTAFIYHMLNSHGIQTPTRKSL